VRNGEAIRGETRVSDPSGSDTERNGAGHLSDAELAGYLDHDLTPAERRRAEIHIDACAMCREEVVALSRIAGVPAAASHPASIKRRRRWFIPAVAAAVIAAIALPRLTRVGPATEPQPSWRVAEPGGLTSLAVVAPANNATVSTRPLAFTWRASDADVYRFFLLTESGDPVWTRETTDTSIVLPDSVTLEASNVYFWHVDGVANGIAATSGPLRLHVAP
jgi:hypothetical protein